MNKKKLVTLLGSVCLVIIFAALPFLAACDGGTPTTPAATTPAPTTPGATTPAPTTPAATTPVPTTPAPAAVITWKYADQDPPTSYANQHTIDPWLDKLEQASNGRVKIDRYHGQTLAKGFDLWDAAKYGLSDISWSFHGYYPGMTPLADVVTLTFPDIENGRQNAIVLWKLFEEFPEIKQSFEKDNHILTFFSNTYNAIVTTPRAGQVKTMDDIKGLKLRAPGRLPSEALTALGAVPTMTSAPDLYTSLQKGTIDGVINSPGFLGNFRIDEVLQYYTYVNFVGNYFSMANNWNSWNNLPADIQKAWADQGLIYLGGTELMGGWVDTQTNELIWGEHGTTVHDEYTLTPEELAKWVALGGKPVWDKWIAEMEGKGLAGQKVFDRYMELVKEVKAEYPAE